MTRSISFGLGIALAVACDADLTPQPIVQRETQGPGACEPDAGPSVHVIPPPECKGRCCPTAPECYPLGNPSAGSGAECMAMIDNTGKPRRQYRQTLSVSTSPSGFSSGFVADALVLGSGLKSAACGAADAVSGFIQLIDFDHANGTSRVGFARNAPSLEAAASEGLCFVEGVYDDATYRLPALPTPPGWPRGLQPPMPLPWDVKVVTATRYPQDFDLARSRAEILARFADGGDLRGRFNGIFFYDEARGYMHGYSPLVYIINYSLDGKTYNAIPLREAEIKQQLNDPAHPNCAGSVLGDNEALPPSCAGTAVNLFWGCPPGNCKAEELAPTSVRGYFLLTELEQVYNGTLQQTLCKAITTVPYPGWQIQASCRSDTARWNPADPANGLPPGDWCSITNSPATPDCHDAWQSVSFSTFQAFPIQNATCAPL